MASPRSLAPLADVRVLDASRVLAGPFCTQILGDLGAEVIKVERPGAGDETRTWGPPFLDTPAGPLSAYYLSCNRNKRGITLDLAQPEGSELFRALAGKCDIVIENFKADSAVKLGLTPEELQAIHPRLIVCSISGFGRDSPWRDVPGYDFAIQAMGGLMSITGPVEGPPSKVGVAMADVCTGYYAAIGILACLHARHSSGHGYAIDLALLDCALASQVNVAQAYLTSGQVPGRQGNAHLQIVPYQLFRTTDNWIVLAVGNDAQWRRFCLAAGRADLAADDRFATNPQRVQQRAILVPMLEEVMKQLKTGEWQRRFGEADVPHAPVWNYEQLFGQQDLGQRGLKVEVRDPDGKPAYLVNTPFRLSGADLPKPRFPPRLGQDTEEVLRHLLQLDAQRLETLKKHGVI